MPSVQKTNSGPRSVNNSGSGGGGQRRANLTAAAANGASRERLSSPAASSRKNTPLPDPSPRSRSENRSTNFQPGSSSGHRPGGRKTINAKEEIKKKFKLLDRDGNGQLDLHEIKELFQKGKSGMTDREVESLFNVVDQDHSGLVDFDEFVDYIYATEHKTPASSEVEVEIPMGGGGIVLGGKAGNAVVKVGFIEHLKVGWRAVAVNKKRLEPAELIRHMHQLNRTTKFTMTFEVDERTALSRIGSFKSEGHGPQSLRDRARSELQELLGCSDLAELGKQTQEQRRSQLSDARLARLLVDAGAVFEAEVLLGGSSGEAEARQMALLLALEAADSAATREALLAEGGVDLLRRDGDGNLPVHIARSVSCCSQLLIRAPEARCMKNADGRNPLNEQVMRSPHGMDREYLEFLLGPSVASARQMLLELDADGINAVMRMTDLDLKGAAGLLPAWEPVAAALLLGVPEVVPSLQALAGDEWPGLLAFHCFRDVLRSATHTKTSWTRLGAVWECLSRTLAGCMMRDAAALEASKALLRASKGPNFNPVDMRLPYRQALQEQMNELHFKSAVKLHKVYEEMQGEAAHWLKWDLKDQLSKDLLPDAFTSQSLFPRLRMDYRLLTGGGASEEVTPGWAEAGERAPLDAPYRDLKRVGMLGDVREKDCAYDMLRLAGMGEVCAFSSSSASLWFTRCYAAYLRGVCQGQQESLKGAIGEAVTDMLTLGETLLVREEAKKFPRIMEKTMQRIEEINHELQENDLVLGKEAKVMLQTSAAFICDINGATLVAQTPEELRRLYVRLTSSFRLLRVKNTYAESASEDYRDLKLFLGVGTAVGELVVEVQLILADSFREKRWMHLPYVFMRGDLDWPYVRAGPPTDSRFRDGWHFYHGIQGSLSRADLVQAEHFLLSAAQQGHFVARGLCHREGWGGFQRSEELALSCFTAAAEAELDQPGKREGQCRLGMFHMGAVTNLASSRRRGRDLLLQSAARGEPEAVYQLAIHELVYEEQMHLLEKAAEMGHQRAKQRVSSKHMSASTRKVLTADD